MRVLIVDGDLGFCAALEHDLQGHGHSVLVTAGFESMVDVLLGDTPRRDCGCPSSVRRIATCRDGAASLWRARDIAGRARRANERNGGIAHRGRRDAHGTRGPKRDPAPSQSTSLDRALMACTDRRRRRPSKSQCTICKIKRAQFDVPIASHPSGRKLHRLVRTLALLGNGVDPHEPLRDRSHRGEKCLGSRLRRGALAGMRSSFGNRGRGAGTQPCISVAESDRP